MKNIKNLVCGLTVLAITFSACKKDEPKTAPVQKTKTEYLTSSSWKTTAFTVNPGINVGGTIITDFYTQLKPCVKDDTEKFNTGGTGVSDEGATKCDPADPQSSPFTWVFNPSETIITVGGDSYDILQLDASTMKYKQVVDGDKIGGTTGINYTLTLTWGH